MGYETKYCLTYRLVADFWSKRCHPEAAGKKFCPECGEDQRAQSAEKRIAKEFSELIAASEEATFCLLPDGKPNEAGKWYNHEDDLRKWSIRLPGVLFILDAIGEDGERWRVYAYTGQVQRADAKISFDEPTII